LTEIAKTGDDRIDLRPEPTVILVAGVNGTGKTTTLGKLAWHLSKELNRSVVLAAGDTFRAAAVEQLEIWAQRADVGFVKGGLGADSASVAFDAIEQRVRLLVQEVLVYAFRPEAGDAQLPARAFVLQPGELSFQLGRLGVEFYFSLQPVLAVRRAPHQIAARDPEHEVENDRQHDRAQASPYDHAPILAGAALARS